MTNTVTAEVVNSICLHFQSMRMSFTYFGSSTGLTIVANVAIATGPRLLVDPWSFVLNLFFIMQGRILEFRRPRQTFKKVAYILHMLYRNVLESKLNFSFCLGFCFA